MAEVEIRQKPFSQECLARACALRGIYLREITKREILEKQTEKMKTEIQDYQKAIEMLLSGVRMAIRPDHISLNMLKGSLLAIDNVVSLHYSIREGVIYLWILEKKEDTEAEIAVAEALSNLFSTFNGLRFDFIIVPLEDSHVEEILPPNVTEVFSR